MGTSRTSRHVPAMSVVRSAGRCPRFVAHQLSASAVTALPVGFVGNALALSTNPQALREPPSGVKRRTRRPRWLGPCPRTGRDSVDHRKWRASHLDIRARALSPGRSADGGVGAESEETVGAKTRNYRPRRPDPPARTAPPRS